MTYAIANPPDSNQILDGITRKGFKEKSGITRNILKQKLLLDQYWFLLEKTAANTLKTKNNIVHTII